MAKLIYKGTKMMSRSTRVEDISIAVAEVGIVRGGDPFECSEDRAAELLASPKLIFERVDKPEPSKGKKAD